MPWSWFEPSSDGLWAWALKDATAPSGTAPTITSGAALPGEFGVPYAHVLEATGDAPITWSVTDGVLPEWASVNDNRIEGTPTSPGSHTFTVAAINAAGSDAMLITIVIVNEMYADDEIPITAPGEVVISESGGDTFSSTGGKKKSRSLLFGAG